MAGTAVGQVVALAFAPVLSRQYSPAEFGIFSIVSACAVVLGTIMALRYELAIPLPHDDEDARSLLALGVALSVSSMALLTAAAWLASQEVAGLVNLPALASWLPWVPAVAMTLSLFRLFNQWALRQQRYAATARRNVLQSVSTVVIQVAAGARGIGEGGLIGGQGGGQLIGALSLLRGSTLTFRVNWRSVGRNARRFGRFPLFLAPAGLLNSAGLYLPLILIGIFYGPVAAGLLGLTQRVLSLPVTLIGQTVAQVYLSELALRRRESTEGSYRLFIGATKRLSAVSGVGLLVLLFAAPPLWGLVFGPEWRDSGELARAMAIALAAQLIASPLSQTLIVLERNLLQLVWDAGRLALVIGAVIIADRVGASLVSATWSLSGALTLAYATSWLMSRHALLSADGRDTEFGT